MAEAVIAGAHDCLQEVSLAKLRAALRQVLAHKTFFSQEIVNSTYAAAGSDRQFPPTYSPSSICG
jgi:hypothetical protein